MSFPRAGVVVLDLLHKLVCEADRDVKVAKASFSGLAVDKLEDVGMINAQYTHIRAMPRLLFDNGKGSVVHVQEGNGSRRLAT